MPLDPSILVGGIGGRSSTAGTVPEMAGTTGAEPIRYGIIGTGMMGCEHILNLGHIDDAVVVAIPDDEITNRLKAVVVLKPGAGLTTDDLKQHCAGTLPRYMVPETIEFRAQLPRTSSGKVDRRALVDA